MSGMPQNTPGGYTVWECMSAMQKSVRRAEPDLAMFFFDELEATGLYHHAANRLKICMHEDVGLADPAAVRFAAVALDDAARLYKGKNIAWRLGVANAVLALCAAEKCRLSDHFQAAIAYRRRTGWRPEVPDHALDRHTRRGRQMGRGLEHFRTEGAVLARLKQEFADCRNATGWHDAYEQDAYNLWEMEAQEKAAPAARPDAEAPGSLFDR